MIPASLEYVSPDTIGEAVTALVEGGEDAKIIAGGQSLLPLLRFRLAVPSLLVDLGKVDELRGVRDAGAEIVIGAMTRHADVIADPLVRAHAGLIAAVTATVADPAVRHRGTLGGSLAHADPAGDLPAAALALEAQMVIEGSGGRRTVAAANFFVDYLQTALAPDEVLVEVRVPKLEGRWGVHYEKFNRVAQAWAIVGVAAAVRRDNGSIAEARIGLTNMGSTPLRAHRVEASLAGVSALPQAVEEAAAFASEGTNPPSDLGGKADYRAHLATVLTRRAVLHAAGIG